MNTLKSFFKWGFPIVMLLMICVAFTGITGGLTWLSNRAGAADTLPGGEISRSPGGEPVANALTPEPGSATGQVPGQATGPSQIFVPAITQPIIESPNTAILQAVNGIVQVQQPDNSWRTIQIAELKTGQTFRTWNYSSAELFFFDGSSVHLEANTRLTLEAVSAPMDSPREIGLFQPYGNTTHSVAKVKGSAISYVVRTPSSSGVARGTVFEVVVQNDKSSQFNVVDGVVAVTGKKNTIQLNAGQMTTVEKNDEPAEPVFWISGQGEVTQTGAVWVIGGLPFQTHPETVITGDPQVGDLVSVHGRLLPDGTRLADRIALLAPSIVDRFRLSGLVESMGDETWIVSGQDIQVDETTDIEEGIVAGNRVLVTGIIGEAGTLFAEHITLLDEDTRFEFTGLVERIEGDIWTISGVAISVNQNTEISGDPVVGDLVKVEGQILPDGTWLALEIKKVAEANQFEFIGTVESLAPWIVSGIAFDVNEFTMIEPGIVVGSTVRVTGMILEDGTWLATSIELLDETNTLVFIGIVDSTDPWVVNGLSLAVDENTVFIGEIGVGSLVRVEVLIQPDGAWLVLQMELIDVGPVVGCVEFVDVVVGLTHEEITLASGVVIPRAIAEVEGELQVGSPVLVKLCFGPDNVMVYAWVLVLDDLSIRPTPTPSPTPTGTPIPDDGGKVTICHIPPGNPGNAHTITVGASAVQAHLNHGDYLGPCQ